MVRLQRRHRASPIDGEGGGDDVALEEMLGSRCVKSGVLVLCAALVWS